MQGNKPLKIVIVTQTVYPALDPRSHKSMQLTLGLADAGHDVTVWKNEETMSRIILCI